MDVSKKNSPVDSHFSIKVLLMLLVMMGFATALSVFAFKKTSMRLDEAQSIFQTSRALGDVFYLVGQDVHVPLYHVLLWSVSFFFGNDLIIARYMSLGFLLATIPAVYFLGKLAFNRRVGLFAAFLVTISPFLGWYGSEARMYSMLAFITVVHQIVFLKLFKQGKTVHWIIYALLSILGMYTHYFFAFVILTEVAFYLAFRLRFPQHTFKKFVATGIVVAASLVPWLWYVQSLGLASNTQPSLQTPSSGDLFNTYAQFFFGFQADYLNTIIVSLWPLVVLLAFFALQRRRQTPPEAIFFVMFAVIPVIGAFIISATVQPLFLSRYLIISLPSLLILLSWILSIYPKKLRRALQVLLVSITFVLLYIQIVNPNTPVKEDYRSAMAYLSEEASGQDVIVATAPFTIYPIEYYYNGPAKLTTQPIWNRFEKGSIPTFEADALQEDTNKNVSSYQRAWLVLSYDQGYNEEIKDYYDSRFQLLSTNEFSTELIVYEYKVDYDPPITIGERKK